MQNTPINAKSRASHAIPSPPIVSQTSSDTLRPDGRSSRAVATLKAMSRRADPARILNGARTARRGWLPSHPASCRYE